MNFRKNIITSFINRTLFFSVLLLLVCSCTRHFNNGPIDNIVLKQTHLPEEYNQWGVTKFSDLKLREELSETSSVLKYVTRGSLLEIIRKNDKPALFDGKKDYWYMVRIDGLTGWIFGCYIDIYNNMEDAEKKCEEILFNTYTKPE